LYARLPGDHYNPKNGMETYTKLLDFYDKSFNGDPTHTDLKLEILKKTQEKIQQNLPRIKAGDEVILKSFKKSAQLFSPDTINSPITDKNFYIEELSNM
jgi:hypothetical protein